MAALTVDVGLVHAERRELQERHDAAALAVAQQCAVGPGCDASTGGLANTYADDNALDSNSRVTTVCGSGATLPGCPAAAGPSLTRCASSLPNGLEGWAEVRTRTETAGGQTLLPPRFARALAGNGSYAGTDVRARAAWGTPSSAIPALPVTISLCEWNRMTGNGSNFAPAPPYSTGYPTSYERAIYLHNTTGATNCPAGPSGSDLPGGFGWLESSGCSATVSATAGLTTTPGCRCPARAAASSPTSSAPVAG